MTDPTPARLSDADVAAIEDRRFHCYALGGGCIDVNQMISDIKTLLAERAALVADLNWSSRQITIATDMLERERQLVAGYVRGNARLCETAANNLVRAEAAEAERDRLQQQLDEADTQLANVQQTLQDVRGENLELADERDALRASVQALEADRAGETRNPPDARAGARTRAGTSGKSSA